ncbi:hypothetical protein AB0C13_32140 [Streptomyces sp. NPDC049099]|uniref:SCO4402 family protein n=1 Tax=Streptomyces sp. NPDC049099 TaxID=3155768 RepID=UPI00342929DC
MTDHGVELPAFRLHVVPAVLALASPSWQRDVWLQPAELEDLDYVINVLFDDFCNADDPAPWLGKSLRTEEEVTLLKELGTAYSAVVRMRVRRSSNEALSYVAHLSVLTRFTCPSTTSELQAG